MASLTMAQTYALARKAGFDPAGAVIISAIAAGESGLRPDAVGDVGLQNAKWGPSVGLTQVRTLKSDTGTGRLRDITRLRDPLQNLVAAYEISGHGRDFSPWSVYARGIYRRFLGQANEAAAGAPGYVPGAVTVQPVGLVDAYRTGANGLMVQAVVIGLGVVLVVVGAVRATGAGSALASLVPVGRLMKAARR